MRPILFVLAFAGTALVTFYHFHNIAADTVDNSRDSGNLVALAILGFALSALPIGFAVLLRRRRGTLWFGTVHLALHATFLFLIMISSSPGHSSPGDHYAPLIGMILVAIWVVQMLLVAGGLCRTEDGSLVRSVINTAFAIPIAVIGGWALGIIAWSEVVPKVILREAEIVAHGRPYCLEAAGQRVSGLRNLTGLSVRARSDNGFTLNFHVLMVIGTGEDRGYANWSFRRRMFLPLSAYARSGLHLDEVEHCQPVPDFAARLLR